jgi:hypothetical protein
LEEKEDLPWDRRLIIGICYRCGGLEVGHGGLQVRRSTMHGSLYERPSEDSVGRPALNLTHWRTQALNCFLAPEISAMRWRRERLVDFLFP